VRHVKSVAQKNNKLVLLQIIGVLLDIYISMLQYKPYTNFLHTTNGQVGTNCDFAGVLNPVPS